ncbi:hypothetical protein V1478_006622 [Vespula squamosa]|uniref:Uncharacterized protein n=1 Tax=Vespula squamosa TaxID=30214 RepID=A0ABD2B8C9_VESSQ
MSKLVTLNDLFVYDVRERISTPSKRNIKILTRILNRDFYKTWKTAGNLKEEYTKSRCRMIKS